MKLNLVAVLSLSVVLLSVSAFRFVQWKPTVTEDDRLKGSYRFERNGWIYVHLEGSPEQIGYQHGKLLSKEIDDLIRVLKPFLHHETKRDWEFYRKASKEILWPKIDAEFQREMDGIVKGLNDAGVKVDRWDIVALNALEELPYYYLPWLDKQQGRIPTTHAPGNCSAMVATGSYTKDHRIVMGHNAWTNYIVGERWNVIFDIKPRNGYRILMDGLPGVITSDDDFGLNSAGIMITETISPVSPRSIRPVRLSSIGPAKLFSTVTRSMTTCASCWMETTAAMRTTGCSETTRRVRLRCSNWV